MVTADLAVMRPLTGSGRLKQVRADSAALLLLAGCQAADQEVSAATSSAMHPVGMMIGIQSDHVTRSLALSSSLLGRYWPPHDELSSDDDCYGLSIRRLCFYVFRKYIIWIASQVISAFVWQGIFTQSSLFFLHISTTFAVFWTGR